MITSLLWKEWRECRWKMLALFATYFLLVLGAWAIEKSAPFLEAQGVVVLLSIVMPGIVAMSTIVDERARRTADTLQSLPVPISRVFLIKTLAGLATLLLPLVAVETLCLLLPGPRDYEALNMGGPSSSLALFGVTTTLYLWILALAAPRRTELGVGATYVFMFVAIAVAAIALEALFATFRPVHVEFQIFEKSLLSISPLGFLNLLNQPITDQDDPRQPFTLIVQIFSWFPLWAIAFLRYTTTSTLRIARPTDRPAALPKSPLAAQRHPILWKTWREIRPTVLTSGAFLLAFIIVHSLVIQNALSSGWYFSGDFPALLVIIPAFISMVIAILMGTDVGLREADVPLENFWHSRPIPQSTYFRRRFSINLACALALVILPAALTLCVTSWQLAVTEPPPQPWLNNNGVIHELNFTPSGTPIITDIEMPRPANWPPSRDPYAVQMMLSSLSFAHDAATTFLLLYTPQAILFFSLSAFAASLARRRIIPLVLSFGTAIAFQMFFVDALRWVDSDGHFVRWGTPAWLLWCLYTFLLLALAADFAWLATKSTTAHWRTRLERLLDRTPKSPQTEILHPAQS